MLRNTLIAVLIFSTPMFVSAQSVQSTLRIPSGFRKISTQPGVTMYRKGREYMQIVSPSSGAKITLMSGKMIPSDGIGTNFARKDLREWWKEWKATQAGAVTLINGQFFNMNNPEKSPLAFSTKIAGIVYAGYGDLTEYKGRKMVLRLGERSAMVEPYSDDAGTLYAFSEPDVIVGLKPDVSKSGNVRRGRTFIGTLPNGDVLIFATPATTQRYATRILMSFGVKEKNIMMLDGGGSTQLIQNGTLLIPSGSVTALRTVPLAIGIRAASAR